MKPVDLALIVIMLIMGFAAGLGAGMAVGELGW